MVRKWSTRFEKAKGGFEATCPYCGATGWYETLSEALRDSITHTEACGEPIHP